MILKTHIKYNLNCGFAALISTILLAVGVATFSIVTLASAVMYSDIVYRKEIRIQVGFNLQACLDTAELMIARDYFISGTSSLLEFGCVMHVSNDFLGFTNVDATATLSGISESGHR
jgi:hypothetical protein